MGDSKRTRRLHLSSCVLVQIGVLAFVVLAYVLWRRYCSLWRSRGATAAVKGAHAGKDLPWTGALSLDSL